MKLNKLLPIVALSGIATVAMPLVACSTNGGDTPEPEKSVDFIISDSKTTGETTATLSLDWKPSEDSIIFSSLKATSKTLEIVSAEFIGASRPQKINLTFVKEISQDLDDILINFSYEDKTQKFTDKAKLEHIHIDKYEPEVGPWEDFEQYGEGTGQVSKGKYEMISGQQYTASWHIDSETESDIILFLIMNNNVPGSGDSYDFIDEGHCSLQIGGDPVDISYSEVEGAPAICATLEESYKGKDINFTVKCANDFANAYLIINMPS